MKILMVCTEYPPMKGGLARYTANLTSSLEKLGNEVYIACNEDGSGDYSGLSPTNRNNSEILMNIVDKLRPDVVHVQFEPGLYGLILDMKNTEKSGTYIDTFYHKCKVPIVTTFHTGYTLRQWLAQAPLVKKTGRTGKLGIPARAAIRVWKYTLNYNAFSNLNKEKLLLSRAGITFSHHMSSLIGGGRANCRCHIIYHGSDPVRTISPTKAEARAYFGLDHDAKIALALGFRTVTKGWDILRQLLLPKGWIIVTNSSRSHYNTESIHFEEHDRNDYRIVDLKRGYLSESDLSLLFYASDVLLLPYTVTAGSGVMFDGLSHGIPFVSSDIGFFKEFANMGLGIASKRDPASFSASLQRVEQNYEFYKENVANFRPKLSWSFVAQEHMMVYSSVINKIDYRKIQR
jgi:glycosyltransferase involved in cell wall biosynthesis